MATMTEAQWRAQKVTGRRVQLCHGSLASVLSYDEANEFALSILGITGYGGPSNGKGATSASKTAVSKKGGKKGGKC